MVRLNSLFLLCSLGWLSASCSTNEETYLPPAVTVTSSARGNLRFKGPERLNSDIATALELPAAAVCTELGMYQCTSAVHTVALGGVDPYGTGLYEPSGVTASTTPLVVERVVWSACTKRVTLDLADLSAAVVFKDLKLNAAKLANPEGDDVRAAITQLVQRALLREPTAGEVTRFMKLAKDIEATGNAEPAHAFMQAVCFAVLSSAEAVFY